MIESTLIKYLSNQLNCEVYCEVPNSKMSEFIVLDRIGSKRVDYITTYTIAIQSYSNTKLEACKLNDAVKKAMEQVIMLDEVACCDLASDYDFTDTETKQYRYQAVFDIVYYDD